MARTDIFSLVLCGGKSSRMGLDKSMLNYHGKPQCYHVYDMLDPLCSRTFISCNSIQVHGLNRDYSIVEDADLFKDHGPLSGVLSAFNKFPLSSFIVVGCDYPLLKKEELQRFISGINTSSTASAFYSDESQYYQPVLAWYSSEAGELLLKNFYEGRYSLAEFLKLIDADKYVPEDRLSMISIDTNEGREYVNSNLMSALNQSTA